MIPVLILGQELLSVQEFAVRGTCMKDCWAVKAREGNPRLLLDGLVGEPGGDWYSSMRDK